MILVKTCTANPLESHSKGFKSAAAKLCAAHAAPRPIYPRLPLCMSISSSLAWQGEAFKSPQVCRWIHVERRMTAKLRTLLNVEHRTLPFSILYHSISALAKYLRLSSSRGLSTPSFVKARQSQRRRRQSAVSHARAGKRPRQSPSCTY